MNIESGFLVDGAKLYNTDENEGLEDFQLLYASKTGFFRIFAGKHLGRKVILKTLKEDDVKNPVAVAQLKKEFSTLFPLESPNIVRAYRLVRLKNGMPAIEMEWCEGKNIRDLLKGELSVKDTIDIVRGILHGLEDVHGGGVIHRDIKPENIIYDPFRRVVKIIDFGCAYITGGLILQGPNGTEGYTPEMKKNVDAEAEPKDDLYALGVMVSEMAESLSFRSKKESRFQKKLRLFSDRLQDGIYETAGEATEEFEKLIKEKKSVRVPAIIVTVVVLCGISFFLIRNLSEPEAHREAAAIGIKPESIHPDAEVRIITDPDTQRPSEAATSASVENVSASVEKTADLHTDHNSSSSQTETKREYINPYSSVSAEDEAAYELAIAAGQLLQRAKSQHSSLQTKMDAFVVNFCDSVYFAEDMQMKLPRDIEEDEKRTMARKLADAYLSDMESKFQQRFGTAGNAHRRSVMLEGRFYCSLLSYHTLYRPKTQTP